MAEDRLEAMLLGERCRDKPVVVVSIAGAARKGKSFMLSLFLRYLRAKEPKKWLKDKHVPLNGFAWRMSSERVTTGIHIWNEVFTIKQPNGEEVCVVLMDTEGTFDCEETVGHSSTVFQYFTAYRRLCLEKNGETPFQDFIFLVRDWRNNHEYKYGFEGGEKFMEKKLHTSGKQREEVKEDIKSGFLKRRCFLTPYPGEKVAGDANFNGSISDMSKDFKKQLKELVPSLLSPENLVPKKIAGKTITCEDLFRYFQSYVGIYNNRREIPEPQSIYQATAEVQHRKVVDEALRRYKTRMDELSTETPPPNPGELQEKDVECRGEAFKIFHDSKKMGDDQMSDANKAQLEMVRPRKESGSYVVFLEKKHLHMSCNAIMFLAVHFNNDNDLECKFRIREHITQFRLQYFTAYGRLCLEKNGETPFQDFIFLVRDWRNSHEYKYGFEGGEKFMEKKLQTSGKQREEVKEDIKSGFLKRRCFHTPYPGEKVAGDANFNGSISDMSKDFKKQMKELVPSLLSPENLDLKKIAGKAIRCEDLFRYFQSYVGIYNNRREIPEPQSIYQATSEVQHRKVVDEALRRYKTRMDQLSTETPPQNPGESTSSAHGILRPSQAWSESNSNSMLRLIISCHKMEIPAGKAFPKQLLTIRQLNALRNTQPERIQLVHVFVTAHSREMGPGQAVCILERTESEDGDSYYTLQEDRLGGMLLGERCRDKPVVVVSIAGAARKGKSFMLSLFLRYLRAKEPKKWLKDKHVPLNGFAWRMSSDRVTTGIHIWNEVFTIKQPNGEEVCVVLMDTEGTFDCEETVGHSSTVFALSTLLSSVQIYNLKENIQMDDLLHLQVLQEGHFMSSFRRMSSDRVTTGIHIWNEVFTIKQPNGEEVCVVLMDTEGTFDCEETVGHSSTVFALSTLLSSVQIYNLKENIQMDDLLHLQYFTAYGRLCLEKNGETPFQDFIFLVRDWRNSHEYKHGFEGGTTYGRLCLEKNGETPFQDFIFLVRDWRNSHEYKHGFEGGEKYMEKKLQTSGKQREEVRKVKEDIKSGFLKRRCFLMPYPGEKVAGDANFNGDRPTNRGRTSLDLELTLQQDFVGVACDTRARTKPSRSSQVLETDGRTPVFASDKIAGKTITCEDLFRYFQSYVGIYNNRREIPEPQSIYQVTTRPPPSDRTLTSSSHGRGPAPEGRGRSAATLQDADGRTQHRDSPAESRRLQEKDVECRGEAFKIFYDSKKMGDDQMSDAYKAQLEMELDEVYGNYQKQCGLKHYCNQMEELFKSSKFYLKESELFDRHYESKREVLDIFEQVGTVCEAFKCYKETLEREIDLMYINYSDRQKKELKQTCCAGTAIALSVIGLTAGVGATAIGLAAAAGAGAEAAAGLAPAASRVIPIATRVLSCAASAGVAGAAALYQATLKRKDAQKEEKEEVIALTEMNENSQTAEARDERLEAGDDGLEAGDDGLDAGDDRLEAETTVGGGRRRARGKARQGFRGLPSRE
ncbi:unnamed protein product [Darwinula stevensoni]|uniref:GB1/RHD3-type G domain-containing protein n=1 Tax=Darwinula stevensoni TaxID=69355 RepID=A0A7R9FQ05_9CRUS|nr:unnamed protein product [Darwinula stevensoni]CAG0898577.1 unnamed protein product [Darwinula stevensoni]